jgi:hypothetical protein
MTGLYDRKYDLIGVDLFILIINFRSRAGERPLCT